MPKWSRVSDFLITLPDRPGQLATLAARFRQADISLIGLWGYGAADGPAQFYCIPESAEQFRNFIESTEIDAREGQTFFLSGKAGSGALVEMLEKIAAAGINLRAIQGLRREGEFGCFIWADAHEWPALMQVLES